MDSTSRQAVNKRLEGKRKKEGWKSERKNDEKMMEKCVARRAAGQLDVNARNLSEMEEGESAV